MSKRLIALLVVLVAILAAWPFMMAWNAEMTVEAKAMVLGGNPPKSKPLAYQLNVSKVKIAVSGDSLTATVNDKKYSGSRITIGLVVIQLNTKTNVLSVDNGKDFPLLIFASKKPLPTPSGTKTKIGKRIVFIGQWLESDCGRVRKIACQLRKQNWTVQISQMSDKKSIPTPFKDAVRTFQYGGIR